MLWLLILFIANIGCNIIDKVTKGAEECVAAPASRFVQVSLSPIRHEPALQSPIALHNPAAYPIYELIPLTFSHDLDSSVYFTLQNTGSSVKFVLRADSSVKPSVSKGAFDLWPPHQLHSLHFHWSTGKLGSEHSVNHLRYPIEAHAVHWNTKYPSYDDASKQPDGLAVLAFFGQLSEEDNPWVIKGLWKDLGTNESVRVTGDHVRGFLGHPFTQSYFYYRGSLTTPPFSENVQWIVFDKPAFSVSLRQVLMTGLK